MAVKRKKCDLIVVNSQNTAADCEFIVCWRIRIASERQAQYRSSLSLELFLSACRG
jgi:hypothetical protein